MFRGWQNIAIGLFWLATMSWLVWAKVLPPLRVGEPPTYRAIARDVRRRGPEPPSAWVLSINGEEIGWARTDTVRDDDERVEIINNVRLDRLPSAAMTEGPLGVLMSVLNQGGPDEMRLDAQSVVSIDPLGGLDEFRSSISLGSMRNAIRVRGRVDGEYLQLTVRVGDFVYPARSYLPPDALLGDVFSPQNRLPRLRLGQTWTVPVFSPFRRPNSPMQVLEAVVERREPLVWQGQAVRTWVVVYRSDQGSGLRTAKLPQGKAWVADDGLVLRQEVQLMDTVLRFVRVAPDELPAAIRSLPKQ